MNFKASVQQDLISTNTHSSN